MPSQVRCSHILVKTEQEVKLILDKIKKGESFAELAQQHSLCPSRKHGGDLGSFGRGMMVRTFEMAAFALEKDQISQPVKTEFGWHVIKRTG
ncbi:MAG: peptidylprolyl isomerase [Candidatus Aenigmarchaeota archaeon]|nr:peptidylprolyl isomerase [Candidatus Aenigmarchaeota archaeon]